MKVALRKMYGALTPAKPILRAVRRRCSRRPAARDASALSKRSVTSFATVANRLRLTSTGHLKLCLFYNVGIPLKEKLRDGSSDEEIEAAITHAVAFKPEAHQGVLASEVDAPTIDAIKACIRQEADMLQGKVYAVCISEARTPKKEVPEALLVAGHGIQGTRMPAIGIAR